MFELIIESEADPEVIGPRELQANAFYLGHRHGDVIIRDPAILNEHLFFEVTEEGLFAHPHPDIDHFLVNGKRATKSKKIELGSKIAIGKSYILIKNAILSDEINFKDLLNEKFESIVTERGEKLSILMSLEAEINDNG